MEIYLMAGLIYMAICLPLSQLAQAFERRKAPR
jgi:ABC-type amino acid transport system permease subunit